MIILHIEHPIRDFSTCFHRIADLRPGGSLFHLWVASPLAAFWRFEIHDLGDVHQHCLVPDFLVASR